MSNLINAIGGRKVLLGLLVMAAGIAIGMYHGDIPPNLLQLLQVIFGAFVVGNSVENVASAMTPPPPSTTQVDLTPVIQAADALKAEVVDIKAQADTLQASVANSQKGISAILSIAMGQPPK